MESASPDINRVIATISDDAGLYGAVLQVVNSPYFGLKVTVTSIKQAVMLLGLSRVFSVVRSAALSSSLGEFKGLERFWDSSVEVAKLSAFIAQDITDESPGDAYTLGMLHDVGVPLMMLAFPRYRRVLLAAIENGSPSIPNEEMISFGCHRYHVGHQLAEKWFLPNYISQAILFQFDTDQAFSGQLKSEQGDPIEIMPHTLELLAILTLARYTSSQFMRFWRVEGNADLDVLPKQAISLLGLTEPEFIDLQKQLLIKLQEEHKT